MSERDTVIRAEQLGKRYLIGHEAERGRYTALRDVISNRLATLTNRLRGRPSANGQIEEFWALRDVSFDIQRGDVVGIIGRNGAGKSTLLKILSRITEPSTGRVEIAGRVASLLEVGTGFHPELTGRENIFLNGAILGMSRAEIKRKFDEIVSFAEVERFLDTPVKRYSSGMYVRLAFAVAAHLEPEILVVDEVLAVGDMQFQKKCLGKMGEVASGGRTVLFVSHNMQAVTQLTSRVVLLNRGQIEFCGTTAEGVAKYLRGLDRSGDAGFYQAENETTNGLHQLRVVSSGQPGIHFWGDPIRFDVQLRITEPHAGICFSIQVLDDHERPVAYFWLHDRTECFENEPGIYSVTCVVPKFRLFMGQYTLRTYLADRRGSEMMESLSGICRFEVSMEQHPREQYPWTPNSTVYLEDFEWTDVRRTDATQARKRQVEVC